MPQTSTRPKPDPAIRSAIAHLKRSDQVMARLIAQVGPFTLRPDRNRFGMLARSIVSQQISTSAARSILARLTALAGTGKLTAQRCAALSIADLRSAGLSPQKASYLSDLAQKCLSRDVRLDRMARLSDEQIIEELTLVKGIGQWTAQMFLIFSLGRLDVFPHADFGVRSALRNLYGLAELPDREAGLRIAASWRPYCSVASWYCWRSLDLQKRGG